MMVEVFEKRIQTEFIESLIQDTSLMVRPSFETTEDQNKQVYLFLKALPDSTMKQVSKGLSIPINTITWRFSDLRKKGLVIEAYRDKEIHWRVR